MMGDWGLLIQEGFLFDIGAYSVENAILEHGCCGCLFEGIFLFPLLYISAGFSRRKQTLLLLLLLLLLQI